MIAMEKARTMPAPDIVVRYAVVLHEFHDLVLKYQSKNFVLRIAANGAVTEKIDHIQREINHLVTMLNMTFTSEMMDMTRRFSYEQELLHQQYERVMHRFSTIMDQLRDQRSQIEAMLMLQFELERHPERHTQGQLNLMKQTLGKIASVSQIDVDGIPDWFISPDDIDYCSKPFTCGVSGALHRGKWGQGTRVVVKTLTVEASMMNFVPPIALWHNLSHPHVLKLFGACHVSSPPFIVCEDATFGNLHDYLTKPSNRDNIWRLLLQAALGMEYLHGRNVVHGNLKCSNILVGADGMARVADFGLSSVCSRSTSTIRTDEHQQRSRSVRWMAPECLLGSEATSRSDLYSFGMVILEAVAGELPWGLLGDRLIRRAVAEGHLPERPDGIPDMTWQLIEDICCSEPSWRKPWAHVIKVLTALAAKAAPGPVTDSVSATVLKEGSVHSPHHVRVAIDPLLETLHSRDDKLKQAARAHIRNNMQSVAQSIATARRALAVLELLYHAPDDEDRVLAANLLSAVIMMPKGECGSGVNENVLHRWLRYSNATSMPVEARRRLAKCLRSFPVSDLKACIDKDQTIELLLTALDRERDEKALEHLTATVKQLTIHDPAVVEKLISAGGVHSLLHLQSCGGAPGLNATTTLEFVMRTKTRADAVQMKEKSRHQINQLIQQMSGKHAPVAARELLQLMQLFPKLTKQVAMSEGVSAFMQYLQESHDDQEVATAALALLAQFAPTEAAVLSQSTVCTQQVVGLLTSKNKRVRRNARSIVRDLGITADSPALVLRRTMMTDKNNQLSHLLNDPALRSVRIPYEEIHVGARIGSTSSTGHFRGRWQHQDVAIRRLSRDLGRTHCHVEELLHQAKLAAKLRHPHIVHVYGVAWNDVNEVSVLTEFVPGGDLRTLLETYSTAKIPVGFDNVEKVRIAYEIALALRFMHSARVMHRNLKSRSIFLSKRGDVKVMAFGTACNMDENYKRTRAGTIRWMAPEVLKGRAYDASADIFSFGAVLAELDNFKRPYEYDDADHAVQGGKLTEIEVARFVIRKKLSIRFSRCQSTCPEMIDMYNLAMACVAFDPNDRPSVQDVLNVLKRALKMLAIGIIGT